MSDTPRTDAEANEQYSMVLTGHGLRRALVQSEFARQLERELTEARTRIKRLEEALGLVLRMQNDWLEMQEDGYAGAYYAFVKGNDSEWEEIIKAKEAKP